jgi:hypothetical protein
MARKQSGMRFVATRAAIGTITAAALTSLWAAIAYSAAEPRSVAQEPEQQATIEAVIEQDGWRWDPARSEWVLIAEPDAQVAAVPAEPAPQRLTVIERQTVYYYVYRYVDQAGTEPSAEVAGSPATLGPGATPAVRPPGSGVPGNAVIPPATPPPIDPAGPVISTAPPPAFPQSPPPSAPPVAPPPAAPPAPQSPPPAPAPPPPAPPPRPNPGGKGS